MPGNRKGFKSSGLPMTYGRLMTRRDRSNERPLRTWGDSLARWYFNLTLVVVAALFASSRGWIAPGLWESVKQSASRIGP